VIPGCFLRARAIGLMPMIDQVKVVSHCTRSCTHTRVWLHLCYWIILQLCGCTV